MTPSVMLTADRAAVTAGDHVVVTATIANSSTQAEQFTLTLRGVEPTWVTFRPPVVSLEPSDQTTATITVTIPADALSADLLLAVELVSRSSGNVAGEAQIAVRLNGATGAAINGIRAPAAKSASSRRGWFIGGGVAAVLLVALAAGGWFAFHTRGKTPQVPPRPLVAGASCAPAGTKIASLFSDDQTTTLRMSDEDYSHLRILRAEPADVLPGVFTSLLALSADNSHLAYVTARNLAMDDAHIWSLDVANPAQRVELAAIPQGFWNVRPAWSPDGKQLVFVRYNEQAAAQGQTQLELWVAEVGGMARKVATPPQLQPESFSRNPTLPLCWAQDNRTVIFPNSVRASNVTDQGTRSIPSATSAPGATSVTSVATATNLVNPTSGTQDESPAAGVQQTQIDVTTGAVAVAARPPDEAPPPTPDDLNPPPATQGGGAASCSLQVFSQNDPRWRNAIMQSAGDSMGNFGCALNSTAMVLNYYGANTDPPQLNKCLGQYADLLYWGQAVRCGNGAVVGNTNFDFSWQNLDQVLSAGKPAIIGMVRGPTGMHFIVVTAGGGGNASNYAVTDPWDGTTNKSLQTFISSGYNPRWIQTYEGRDRGCVRITGPLTPAANDNGVSLPGGRPLAPSQLMPFFTRASEATGVPKEILLAIARIESNFTPRAQGPLIARFAGTEDAHALGMMQFLPSTYRGLMSDVDKATGKNLGMEGIYDPESAIFSAAFYLKRTGAPGDLRRSIYAYNNADWYVDEVLELAKQYANGVVLDDTIFDPNSGNKPGTRSDPNPQNAPVASGVVPTNTNANGSRTTGTGTTVGSVGTPTTGMATGTPTTAIATRTTATTLTTTTTTTTSTSTITGTRTFLTVTPGGATVMPTRVPTVGTGTRTISTRIAGGGRIPSNAPPIIWSVPDGSTSKSAVRLDLGWVGDIGDVLSASLYTLTTPGGSTPVNQLVPVQNLVPGMTITDEGIYQAVIVTRLNGQTQVSRRKFTIDRTSPTIDVALGLGTSAALPSGGVTLFAAAPVGGQLPAAVGQTAPVSRGPATLDVHYADQLSGVATVEYQLDGGEWQILFSTATFRGKQTVSAPGMHRMTLRATDLVGNISPERTLDFTVLPANATPVPVPLPTPTPLPSPSPAAAAPTTATVVPSPLSPSPSPLPATAPAMPTPLPGMPPDPTPSPPPPMPTPVPLPLPATSAPAPVSTPEMPTPTAVSPTATQMPTVIPTASNAPAVLKLPADIVAEGNTIGGATVPFAVSATDPGGAMATVTCDPASGTLFKVGTATVNCTAKDSAGNVTTGSFKVTVRDTQPPAIKLPPDRAAEATVQGGAVIAFDATAADIVDGTVPVLCSAKSGDLFPVGTTRVTCSAKDAAGNPATASFAVVIRDSQPPTLTLPANISVEATSISNYQNALVTYTASATDTVDGAVAAVCVLPSGSYFPVGMTTVYCTATDTAGNKASGMFTVTVTRPIPPARLVVSPTYTLIGGRITIQNTGGQPLTWSARTTGAYVVSQTSGTVAAYSSTTIIVSASQAPGSGQPLPANGSVLITSNGGSATVTAAYPTYPPVVIR